MYIYPCGLLSSSDLWVNGLHKIQKNFDKFFRLYLSVLSLQIRVYQTLSVFSQVTEAPPLSLACFVSACHLVLVFSALSFQVHWSFFNIESAVNSSSEFFISCFLFLWVAFDSCLCFPSFLIAFVFLFKSLGILLMTILWRDYLLILSSPSLLSQFHLIDFPLGSESPFPHGYYV